MVEEIPVPIPTEKQHEKPKSLSESLKEISEKLDKFDKEKKVKKWQLPWKYRFLGKRKKRMGYVVVIHISTNRTLTFSKLRIDENIILDQDGVPHVVTPDDILIWKNKIPIIIQPSWSTKPFSPREHFEKTIENKNSTKGWQFLINYMYKTQIQAKKQFRMGLIVLGVILVVGIAYYLIKSGAFS